MRKENIEKTEIEILQERAEILGQAGERLSKALDDLRSMESNINSKLNTLCSAEPARDTYVPPRRDLIQDINNDIRHYNEARDYAKLRFYYLIVTREAMGFRRHKMVEECYFIPPKKKLLKKQ